MSKKDDSMSTRETTAHSTDDGTVEHEIEHKIEQENENEIEHKIEQEKGSEEDVFRQFFETAPDPMYIASENDRFTVVNRAALDLFGYTREDMVGLHFEELYSHPTDFYDFKQEMEEQGNVMDFEARLKNRNDRVMVCTISSVPMTGKDGDGMGHRGTIRQIQQLTVTEDALWESLQTSAGIVQAIPSGLLILQYLPPDWFVLLEGNSTAERLTGLVLEETCGMKFNEVWSGAKERGLIDDFVRVMKTGKPYETNELLYTREGQEDKLFSLRAFHMPGKRLGVSIEDITKKKRTEEELKDYRDHLERLVSDRTAELEEANEKLKDAARMKDEFVSILAHDLGTPMAAMIGNIELLKEGLFGTINDKQANKLDAILRNVLRVNNLRKNTLHLSRMDRGTMTLDKSRANMNDLLGEAMEDIHRLADEKNQVIENELPDMETLECDPEKIRQVVDNYLSNAVRYTGEGGAIRVGGEATWDLKSGRGDVTVWVKDNGRGVPAEDLERIFERFYRSGERIEGSTGLGLAIAKSIVEAHGGRTWCESDGEGTGSTFYFSLPR